jgi:hypothetical protein
MDSRLDISRELLEISPLIGGIEPLIPFTVPEGYFEGFYALLMQRIQLEGMDSRQELAALSPLLSGISRQLPFDLPENYFVDLSDQALVGAKAIDFVNEELENLSPLMNDLKGNNVYEVPVGYFSSLSDQVLVRVRKQQPAKVVRLRPMRKILQYAVAAMIVGFIAIGGWFMQSSPGSTETIASSIKNASDEEIMNFIQNDEAPLADPVLSTDAEMDESDMKAMLADISDKELEQFSNESIDQNNTLSN